MSISVYPVKETIPQSPHARRQPPLLKGAFSWIVLPIFPRSCCAALTRESSSLSLPCVRGGGFCVAKLGGVVIVKQSPCLLRRHAPFTQGALSWIVLPIFPRSCCAAPTRESSSLSLPSAGVAMATSREVARHSRDGGGVNTVSRLQTSKKEGTKPRPLSEILMLNLAHSTITAASLLQNTRCNIRVCRS